MENSPYLDKPLRTFAQATLDCGGKVRNLFFAQGEEASAFLDLLDECGADALLDYMADAEYLNWDGELSDRFAAGNSDRTVTLDRYVLSYNLRLGYLGVEYVHTADELAECAA